MWWLGRGRGLGGGIRRYGRVSTPFSMLVFSPCLCRFVVLACFAACERVFLARKRRHGNSLTSLPRFTNDTTVPLKHLASELNLPIHERDTFTGFEVRTPPPQFHPKLTPAAPALHQPRHRRLLRPLRAAAHPAGRQVRRAERPPVVPPRVSPPTSSSPSPRARVP